MKNSVRGIVKYFLEARASDIYLSESLAVNDELVGDQIHITDDFISFQFDGTVHTIGEEESFDRKFNKMPFYDKNGGEFQVLISEYTVNTIMRSVVELDLFSYNQTLS